MCRQHWINIGFNYSFPPLYVCAHTHAHICAHWPNSLLYSLNHASRCTCSSFPVHPHKNLHPVGVYGSEVVQARSWEKVYISRCQKFLTLTPILQRAEGSLAQPWAGKVLAFKSLAAFAKPAQYHATQPTRTQQFTKTDRLMLFECDFPQLTQRKTRRGWKFEVTKFNLFPMHTLTMVVLLLVSKTVLSFSTQRFKEDLMSDSIGSGSKVSAVKKETSHHHWLKKI